MRPPHPSLLHRPVPLAIGTRKLCPPGVRRAISPNIALEGSKSQYLRLRPNAMRNCLVLLDPQSSMYLGAARIFFVTFRSFLLL